MCMTTKTTLNYDTEVDRLNQGRLAGFPFGPLSAYGNLKTKEKFQ